MDEPPSLAGGWRAVWWVARGHLLGEQPGLTTGSVCQSWGAVWEGQGRGHVFGSWGPRLSHVEGP